MAVFLYASIFVADGKYADYCCYDGNKPWKDYTTDVSQFSDCCCEVNTCQHKTYVVTGSSDVKLWEVPSSGKCQSGKCGDGKDKCVGETTTTCSKISHHSLSSSQGVVLVHRTVTHTVFSRVYAKTATPLRIGDYEVTRTANFASQGKRHLASARISQEDGVENLILNLFGPQGVNSHSGGNATATAEEADEVVDKFLADAEMELSNPVLITSVGAVFVILLAAIYCFCCKKKRGANDSRSESHGRQHSNKRNATRYTKPRKEFRKAHE